MRAPLLLLVAGLVACGGPQAPSPPPSATSDAIAREVSVEEMLRALPAHSEIIAVINYKRLRTSPLARELYDMFAERREVKMIVDALCAEAFRELELGVYGGALHPKVWVGWHMGATRADYDRCRTSTAHRDVAAQLEMTEHVHDDVITTTIGPQRLQYLWIEPRVMTIASGAPPAPELTAAQLRALHRTPKPDARGVLGNPDMARLYAQVDQQAGFWGFFSSDEMKRFGLVGASYSFDITDQITVSGRLIATDEAKAAEVVGFAKPMLDKLVAEGRLERGEAIPNGREIKVSMLMTRAGLASLLPQRPLFGP